VDVPKTLQKHMNGPGWKAFVKRRIAAYVREQANFWGCERFLPDFHQTCPRSFWANLSYHGRLCQHFHRFAQIFDKSKLLGVRLYSRLLHHWDQVTSIDTSVNTFFPIVEVTYLKILNNRPEVYVQNQTLQHIICWLITLTLVNNACQGN